MKILFMGTPEFAAVNLKAIVDKHDVVAVVSQPDRPKGRGKKLQPTPVKEVALEYNIPVYQPEKIKDKEFVDFLKTIDADVYVVVADIVTGNSRYSKVWLRKCSWLVTSKV